MAEHPQGKTLGVLPWPHPPGSGEDNATPCSPPTHPTGQDGRATLSISEPRSLMTAKSASPFPGPRAYISLSAPSLVVASLLSPVPFRLYVTDGHTQTAE